MDGATAMRVGAGVATDIGRVREANEDSFLVEAPLYAVADGMGGHRGGDVASRLALDTIESLFRTGKGSLPEHVRQANHAVFERSRMDRAVTGMGTTVTAAVVDGDSIRLAHVGDSRAYLSRGGALRQLTTDHTLVDRMVKAGEISRAEADVHPHRNVLTRALGTEPEVRVDEEEISLIDGDRVLLCSDGLTAMVTEEQILAILESSSTPQEAADRLVRAANRAGGVDNITVVVLGATDDAGPAASADTASRGEAAMSEDRRALRGTSLWRRVSRPTTVRRWIVRGVVVLVALAAIAFAGRAYLDHQWYVGVFGDRVAVFQGIPATPLGIHLSAPVFVSSIPSTEAAALPLYGGIASGIAAKDRDDAFAIVEQIRRDVAAASTGPKGSSP